jgi:carboxymethylenebutenolidase
VGKTGPMALRDYLTGEVAQDHADGLISRREAVRRLGLMGLSAASASAALAACASNPSPQSASGPTTSSGGPAATAPPGTGVPGADTAVKGEAVRFPGTSGELQGTWAAPPADTKGAVLVIHENRGMTRHFVDLVGRFAGVGYAALVVDLLSPEGGTASLSDPAQAPALLSQAPAARLQGDLKAGLDELGRREPGAKLGAVGFCFGGGMTWGLLQGGETRLAAASPFYGPVPDPADFSKAEAAVLGVFAELDDRVNAGRDRAAAALTAAGLPHEIRTFAGANHAFFNDTGERYNPVAANDAWAALLDWFDRYLVR